MYNIIEVIDSEISYYESIKDFLNKADVPNVDGKLVVAKRDNKNQFYVKYENSSKRVYLKKEDSLLRDKLAMNKYYGDLAIFVDRRLKLLKNLRKNYENNIFEIFDNLGLPHDSKCKPFDVGPSKRFEEWKNEKYEAGKYDPDLIFYRTKKDEIVRSKSEKIIADFLFDAGIEYRYEKPLKINGYSFRPDFTFYSEKFDKVVYWEHFGMAGVDNYEKRNFSKINFYQQNGLVLGDNLILTFEGDNLPLNMTVIKSIISKYF